jgi:hypothetical protein
VTLLLAMLKLVLAPLKINLNNSSDHLIIGVIFLQLINCDRIRALL